MELTKVYSRCHSLFFNLDWYIKFLLTVAAVPSCSTISKNVWLSEYLTPDISFINSCDGLVNNGSLLAGVLFAIGVRHLDK